MAQSAESVADGTDGLTIAGLSAEWVGGGAAGDRAMPLSLRSAAVRTIALQPLAPNRQNAYSLFQSKERTARCDHQRIAVTFLSGENGMTVC